MPVTPAEWLSFGKLGWNAVSKAWHFLRRNHRKLTAQEKLAARLRWKEEFERELRGLQHEKLRRDIIIRDMRRMDHYPNIDDKAKGISPWFRAGLIDTYERGFMAGLGFEGLFVDDQERIRFVDRAKGEEANVSLMITGYIPYESIESVDWRGDGYYNYPHIYCYFEHKGEPYERVAYCEPRGEGVHEYYHEVVDYESVRKLSKKLGIKRF